MEKTAGDPRPVYHYESGKALGLLRLQDDLRRARLSFAARLREGGFEPLGSSLFLPIAQHCLLRLNGLMPLQR